MTDESAVRHEEEKTEAEKHDVIYQNVGRLVMSPSAWERFDHIGDTLDAYYGSMKRMGDVKGLNVLDAGCGDGWMSVILAKRGAARVDAFDISPEGIRVAKQRAETNGVATKCRFVVGSFYDIPFDDGSADAVMGQSILHHLGHKDRAATELNRVMKPGAYAIFAEPFGNVLWLERLRLYVPVASQAPEDPDEWKHQLKYSDLEPFRQFFDIEVDEYHLFSRIDRIISWQPFKNAVARMDRVLLRGLPFLRPFARSVVVRLRKRAQ